ncbi:MAG: ATP-dependent helicase [Acidimicrobiia bacterium]|nr:ATP-dependent helicase [Acidimicrobiia bacterium]
MNELRLEPGAWDSAIADTDGPQLVVAGPGAGKTEFLVRRARHLITAGIPPEQILILAFSRRGAADLRSRIASGLERSFSVIPASTFHSLAMRILEAHGPVGGWVATPTLLTGPEHVELVADVLAGEDPAAWPLPFRGLLGNRAFAEEVADFGLRAAERLVGTDALAAFGRDDWRALPGFFDRYLATLRSRGRIDYGTLQVEALRVLEHPATAAQFAGAFRYVLVDEYQDTTVAQARMAERLAAGHRNLTAAGDPYQSVYSFRGAELSNVAEFPERFRDDDGNPARRIVLTTSFRVPAAILDAAVRLTVGAGLPGGAGPVDPAPGAGSVETYGFNQQSAEAEWIASEVQHVHLRDRIPYRRMGVLVRSKRRFLPELSRALDRRRIPHQRPDTRLGDHRAVRPVLDLAEAAAGRDTAVLRRVLMGPLVGLTLSATREIERRASVQGWAGALAGAADAVQPVVAALADPTWATDRPAADGFWHLWTTLPGLTTLGLGDADDRRALSSFSQALDRLRERDPGAGLADYAAMVRSEDFEAEPLLSFRDGDADRITLTTLHQAKGMEFDIVFIADAREGVLPDLRARDSLLGTRHLSPSLSGDDRAYSRFRIQEERRLAYTAMCRASRRVVWTATVGSPDHADGAPSRFLSLVAGMSLEQATRPPEEHDAPTTPRDAEAWVRRRVGDVRIPAVDRIAALGALAAGDPWQPRALTEFAGVLPVGPDTGIVGSVPRLSPSQAEAYATCPRRYAFERRLLISDGGSKYAELGSLLHRVLEVVERQAVESGRDHGDVATAVAVLDEEFDPAAFDGAPWADSWRDRAERILTHLYTHWPGKGRAVGFETAVSHVLDGIEWRGRVDRAERRADGVHIVDYKTGASALPVDEAAAAVQLGFYVLASGEGTAGAEFWYPGHEAGKRKSVTVRRFDMTAMPTVVAEMTRVQRGILAEEWPATPGDHCDRCPVRIVCPEWPEGREAFS